MALSKADLEKLKEVVAETMRAEVPPLVRNELVNIGLAVQEEDGRVAAQADMIFLRKMRIWFDGAVTTVGRTVLISVVGMLLSLIAAGFMFYKSRG